MIDRKGNGEGAIKKKKKNSPWEPAPRSEGDERNAWYYP